MGQHDLIVLTFRGALRGREQRPGYLPSDMLWGALYSADVRLQGAPLPTGNPYRVSSAFPFVGGDWLLPKPRVSAEEPEPAGRGSSLKKKAKGLNYVRLADFLTLARGQRLTDLDAALAAQRRALLPVGGAPLTFSDQALERALRPTKRTPDALARERYGAGVAELSGTEKLHLVRQARGRSVTGQTERQRNSQDRVTAATETFMTAGLAQPRVAFLLETTSPEQRTRLMAALRLLADSGLGGLRTQGSGQFEFELRPVPAELGRRLRSEGPQILLGLTRPSPEEARAIDEAEGSRYGLIRRDGFLDGTGQERQDVWMLTEGSLVPGPLAGTLTDVAPPNFSHPVWRSGLALSVGVSA